MFLSQFVTFQHFDYFVNPAHADPTWFSTFSPDNYLYTMRSHDSKKTSLCLSLVFVVRSRLLEPHPCSQSNTSLGNRMLLKSLDCISIPTNGNALHRSGAQSLELIPCKRSLMVPPYQSRPSRVTLVVSLFVDAHLFDLI